MKNAANTTSEFAVTLKLGKRENPKFFFGVKKEHLYACL